MDINVMEIIERNCLHLSPMGWDGLPVRISMELRFPAENDVCMNDPFSVPMYLGSSIQLHSVRGELDQKFNNNDKLFIYRQRMWPVISYGDQSVAPQKFQSTF
jgi:hypothetical protein